MAYKPLKTKMFKNEIENNGKNEEELK